MEHNGHLDGGAKNSRPVTGHRGDMMLMVGTDTGNKERKTQKKERSTLFSRGSTTL